MAAIFFLMGQSGVDGEEHTECSEWLANIGLLGPRQEDILRRLGIQTRADLAAMFLNVTEADEQCLKDAWKAVNGELIADVRVHIRPTVAEAERPAEVAT